MRRCLVCEAEVPPNSVLYRSLLRCPVCGFVFADVTLSEQDARRIYQDDYFADGEYADYLRDKPVSQRNFAHRIETLARFSNGGKLYEIGSAYGFFLEMAQARWQVEGIDITTTGCAYAREKLRLNVQCGEFLEASLADEAYDVFCLWDTIEHLREPDRYLAKIARHLRRGGHLALTTGDVGSWSARLQESRWRLIHPPTHLYYFSAATLTRLLARHGLTVAHISYPGFYRSADTMVLGLLGRLGGWGEQLYRRLSDAGWMRRGIYLNLFDIMLVIACKQ